MIQRGHNMVWLLLANSKITLEIIICALKKIYKFQSTIIDNKIQVTSNKIQVQVTKYI